MRPVRRLGGRLWVPGRRDEGARVCGGRVGLNFLKLKTGVKNVFLKKCGSIRVLGASLC